MDKDNFKVRNIDTGVICNVVRKPTGIDKDGERYTYNISWEGKGRVFNVDYAQSQFQYAMGSYLEMEEEVQLPHTFIFKSFGPTIYTAIRSDDGLGYSICWDTSAGETVSLVYGAKDVANYVKNGAFIIQPETFVDTSKQERIESDDLVDTIQGVEYDRIWLEELEDVDVSLTHLQTFSAETGAKVEVCADFITVVYVGANFLAKDAAQLTSVLQAVRTLEAARDKG